MSLFNKSPITQFKNSYFFLSNFYPCEVQFEGKIYPSSEHAYVASKTTEDHIRNQIKNIDNAAEAKKMGRKIQLRENWDELRLFYMEEIVRSKFSNPFLAKELRKTNPCEIIEGNHWGDRFWGQSPVGNGENHLGKILMKIRSEL